MDKDFGLKNDPRYGKSHLRQKIDDSIKRQRDSVCEVKEEPVKALHNLPSDTNRTSENLHKHFRNKFVAD